MLADGVVETIDNAELFEPAIDLSFAIKHPLADCLYLNLAKSTDSSLVTFDGKQRERGKTRCRVKLLVASD